MALSMAQTGTADFASAFRTMRSFTLTAGADAATVNLREGGAVGGDIKFVVKAAINTTVHLDFGEGVRTDDNLPWYVDLSAGTTPQMTITGQV